jgi:hypothetical protein
VPQRERKRGSTPVGREGHSLSTQGLEGASTNSPRINSIIS